MAILAPNVEQLPPKAARHAVAVAPYANLEESPCKDRGLLLSGLPKLGIHVQCKPPRVYPISQ